jgi:AcrR family transcriptional regulator
MGKESLTFQQVQTSVSNGCMAGRSSDTKTRILNVAEQLFAEDGLDRVSIRHITEAAEVNLAAVNYHFGGKEELIAAVFERRLRPVNQARITALEGVEEKAHPKAPKVEDILAAFIRPAVACCGEDESGSRAFSKLFGRCLAETRPEIETLLRKQFQPLADKLEIILRKALPHLSRSDVFWRLKFTFGALHHWLLTKDKLCPQWAAKTDLEEQTSKLIAFAAAGFKAR